MNATQARGARNIIMWPAPQSRVSCDVYQLSSATMNASTSLSLEQKQTNDVRSIWYHYIRAKHRPPNKQENNNIWCCSGARSCIQQLQHRHLRPRKVGIHLVRKDGASCNRYRVNWLPGNYIKRGICSAARPRSGPHCIVFMWYMHVTWSMA